MRKPRPLPPPLPLARWRAPSIPCLFRIPPPFRRFNAAQETGWARDGIPLGNKILVWAESWTDGQGRTNTLAVVHEDPFGYRAIWVRPDGQLLGFATLRIAAPRTALDDHDPRVRAWCIATADAAVRALRTVAPEPPPVPPEAEAWLRRQLAELDPTPEAPA